MRILRALAAVCLISVCAGASTVTANLQTITRTNVTSGAYFQFTLKNANGNPVRAVGTAFIDTAAIVAKPDVNGNISISIYGNDELTAYALNDTYYYVEVFDSGNRIYAAPFKITGTTFNLNSAVPMTLNPPAGVTPFYVSKNGDTMLGILTLSADPTNPNDAATKNYVDTASISANKITQGILLTTVIPSLDTSKITTGNFATPRVITGTITGAKCLHTSSDGTQINETAADCGSGGAGGGVNSVSANAPLASTGGSAPTVTITQAGTSTDGYLAQADWNTFNGKQANLGFTPENSSNKDASGGYAGLSGGKIAVAEITKVPSITDLSTYTALSGTGTTAIGATISSPSTGQSIQWNGTNWVNSSQAYSTLTGIPTTFAPSAHTHGAADTVSGTRVGSRCIHTSGDGSQLLEAAADCGGGGGGGGGVTLTPTAGVSQSIVQQSGTNLNINRFEKEVYCDQFASLQACHDDLPTSGGIMHLANGTLNVCSLNISKNNVHIVGTGEESTILACATANAPVIILSGDQPYIEDLTVKHITTQPTCGGGAGTTTCGEGIQWIGGTGKDRPTFRHVKTNFNYNGFYLGYASYGVEDDLKSERNVNDGFFFGFTASKAMYHNFNNVISQQNGNDGFDLNNATGTQITCPTWTNSTTYANGQYGWYVNASTPSGLADCWWWGGSNASTNNNSGFYLNTGAGGRNHIISGSYSELSGRLNDGAGGGTGIQIGWATTPTTSNVGYGYEVTGLNDNGGSPSIQLGNLTAYQNAFSGVYAGNTGMSLSNVNTNANGKAASASPYRVAGITVRSGGVSINGGFHRGETNGIEVSNGATNPSVSNVQCESSVTTCTLATTAPSGPTTYWSQNIGLSKDLQGTGVPSGACSQNGDTYHRTDGGNVNTLYVCQNAVWVPGAGATLSPVAVLGAGIKDTTWAQQANGNTMIYGSRNTDTSPTGNFIQLQNQAANADLFKVDIKGNITGGNLTLAGSQPFGAYFNNDGVNACAGSVTTGMTMFLCNNNGALNKFYNGSLIGNMLDTSSVAAANGVASLDAGTKIPAAQLPNPSASTLGGVESIATIASKWVNGISTSGVPTSTQPATTDLSDWPSISGNNGKVLTLSAGVPAWASNSSTLVYQEINTGTVTDTTSGADFPIFTGTNVTGGTLTSGHSMRITVVFKHNQANSSSTKLYWGGAAIATINSSSTGTSAAGATIIITATSSTQGYATIVSGTSPSGSTLAAALPVAFTTDFTATKALNVDVNVASGTDTYNAGMLVAELI